MFERAMTLQNIKEQNWVRHLVPLLSGKAKAAYNEVDAQAEHPVVKNSIPNRLEVTPDVSRVKLSRMKFKLNDNMGDYLTRVRMLTKRWLIPEKDLDETNADLLKRVINNVVEELTMEHVQSGIPKELQECINARGPTSVKELQQCIREHQLQHPGPQPERHSTSVRIAQAGNPKRTETPWRKDKIKQLQSTCFKCGKPSHYARNCQEKRYGNQVSSINRMICTGKINRQQATRIHLDTGSSMTSVHRKFVPVSADMGHFVEMRNTTGNPTYPIAVVEIDLDGHHYR